jgi:hypothetical protein
MIAEIADRLAMDYTVHRGLWIGSRIVMIVGTEERRNDCGAEHTPSSPYMTPVSFSSPWITEIYYEYGTQHLITPQEALGSGVYVENTDTSTLACSEWVAAVLWQLVHSGTTDEESLSLGK